MQFTERSNYGYNDMRKDPDSGEFDSCCFGVTLVHRSGISEEQKRARIADGIRVLGKEYGVWDDLLREHAKRILGEDFEDLLEERL